MRRHIGNTSFISHHLTYYKSQGKGWGGCKNRRKPRKQMVEGWKEQVIILCLSTFLNSPPCTFRESSHTCTRTNAAISCLPLFFLPHTMLASFTVWIFLLLIEEGFALVQQTKGKSDAFTDTWRVLRIQPCSCLSGISCHHMMNCVKFSFLWLPYSSRWGRRSQRG